MELEYNYSGSEGTQAMIGQGAARSQHGKGRLPSMPLAECSHLAKAMH